MFDASKQYQDYIRQCQSFFAGASATGNNGLEKVQQLNQEAAGTWAEANKFAVENAQKFFKAQTDFFQEQAQKAANAATKAVSAKTPEEGLESQTKFAQEALDASIQNVQSATKNASEAAVKVFDIINKQAVEYFSEISKLAPTGTN